MDRRTGGGRHTTPSTSTRALGPGRTPAPAMERDNEAVLEGVLGVSAGELRELDEAAVIGKQPKGV